MKKQDAPRKVLPLPTMMQKTTAPRISTVGPRLSEEELSRRLAAGAKIGTATTPDPGDSARCQIAIRDQLYAAWIRPDASHLTGRAPEVEIRLGPGGEVRGVSLSKSSGSAVLDESVLSAARAVRRFRHLSETFVRANPSVTVSFRLEEG